MLHDAFISRMKNILGDEFPEFYESITEGEAVRGARVNLIKASADYVPEIPDMARERIPYAKNAYIVTGDGHVGQSPEHHAGLIYMQDPGAMAAIEALDIEGDLWVADLCAAPGGKSSQIAERLGEGGFLLSNEYVPKRAKIIVGNMERLGIRRAIVTSADTSLLAEWYPECFDLVVCDAPCSGEGMFRKNDEAVKEWSPENVLHSAKRQMEIVENAYRMVRPGGRLLYSTCTWSTEEDEMIVLSLLDRHSDLEIIPVKEAVKERTSPGIIIREGVGLEETRRVYPHRTRGEGQYIALLQKNGESPKKTTIVYKEKIVLPKKDEKTAIEAFLKDVLVSMPDGRIIKNGDYAILVPHDCPIPPHSTFMSGVVIGEVRRGVVHPHHQFFSAYGSDFKRRIELSRDDAARYLEGEELGCDSSPSGYAVVTFMGAALGGVKISSGRMKNHYPKGLRNK